MAANTELRNIQRATEQTSEAISKLCFYAVYSEGVLYSNCMPKIPSIMRQLLSKSTPKNYRL